VTVSGRTALNSSARLAAVLAGTLLAGCSLLPKHSPEGERQWQARRADLERIERFTLQGRVAAGLFGGSGTVHWRQDGARYDLRLSAPGGTQAVRIQGDDRRAEVRTPQERWTTDQPEALLRERLGLALPLAQLRHWVLGRPAPGSEASLELDESGHITALEQDGWELEIAEYMDAGARQLPRRLRLEGPEVTLKLVVDAWTDLP